MDPGVGDRLFLYLRYISVDTSMYLVDVYEKICFFIPKCQDSVVNGGVLIEHQIHEGKHQYEVKDVVKYKKGSGGKAFARYDSDASTQTNTG